MVIFHGYASFLEGILATGAKWSTPPMSVSGKFAVRPWKNKQFLLETDVSADIWQGLC